jgi:hypothetical protein
MGRAVELHVEERGIRRLAIALHAEADGKKLRRDFIRELRQAVDPAKDKAKSAIMSMHSSGLTRGQPLRAAIASQVKSEVRVSGKLTGIRVKAGSRGMPRRFAQAPRRTNSGGWRHPVFGRDTRVWVHQIGKPGWFDDTLAAGRDDYRIAVHRAMEATARRITTD